MTKESKFNPYKNLSPKEIEIVKKKISSTHKGKPKSKEQREKMSKSAKNRKKVTCPYCSKEGLEKNMMKYHFENCKKKGK